MIANLMMYERPQLADAHDRYWALISQNLTAAGMNNPETLSQTAEEFFVWNHPDLVLSQTCGMPYRTWLHHKVQLVGTPDYGLADCPAGYYRSAIIVRADDPRTQIAAFKDAVFAYNQTFSQSGYAAPFYHLKPQGIWFENRFQTHQHVGSARAVATGQADIASIDAVTWRNIEKFEPFATGLRVLDWTTPTPGLPLITASGNNADLVFNAVRAAIAALEDQDKALLGITGIVKIPKADYLKYSNPD
ncbi:phosphate/phosphite/phosphonate ABC transporter substrate-binding protein [Pseudorhodobacter ferrugineus]|uniref:phosphate/phosphite/phosphonate ABC transporter substrate-binding protein n=1 Tax=Pseudorhodobacter ferrugineus TaxID=77008 RepID=UPI0003B548AD|nr:PhnD/SsuA/transferrin family substrate-binding protein [Pseudorhodobacter ferrugineus]